MQDRFEHLGSHVFSQNGRKVLGTARSGLQGATSPLVERMDRMANRLFVAGEDLGDGGAVSPRAEAKRIWLRGSTKASEERNPAESRFCSSSERVRIKMRGLIALSIPHPRSSLVRMH